MQASDSTSTEITLPQGTACELLLESFVVRIDTHFLIKITDFGLSEDVFVRNYIRQCI